MELFHHPGHARTVTELWRHHENMQRPPSAPEISHAPGSADVGCAAGECMYSPPEDTGPVTALSSGGAEPSRGGGVGVRDVLVRARVSATRFYIPHGPESRWVGIDPDSCK